MFNLRYRNESFLLEYYIYLKPKCYQSWLVFFHLSWYALDTSVGYEDPLCLHSSLAKTLQQVVHMWTHCFFSCAVCWEWLFLPWSYISVLMKMIGQWGPYLANKLVCLPCLHKKKNRCLISYLGEKDMGSRKMNTENKHQKEIRFQQ